MNIKSVLIRSLFVFSLSVFIPTTTQAQNDNLQKLAVKRNNGFELRIDKNMSDDDLKKDEADAKKYDFEVSFSGVKRNDKKEITAIKIAYKDKNGNSGNYNVADETPIAPISIRKQVDARGKGLINITSGTMNGPFGEAFAWNGNGMGNMFNDDMFQGLMEQPFQMKGDFNFEKLEELQKELGEGNGMSRSFIFKDGKMMGDNPDMKLEEEQIEDDGTVTKKYSDGKGGTMIIKEKNFSSDKEGDLNELDKMKKENKIQIEKSIKIGDDTKIELEKLKSELEKTKTDLEKLKSDLNTDKGSKGPKGKK